MLRRLGLAIEHRGKDATGVAQVRPSKRVRIAKAPQRAWSFFSGRQGLGEGAVTALVHTRAWTQGSPAINNNNHPVVTGNIVGIHNGWVLNDEDLWKKNPEWPRLAEVDSEVIFRAIHELGAKKALETVEGNVAVAWLDVREPDAMWLAKGDGSPLWIGFSPGGSLIFASTKGAVNSVPDLVGGAVHGVEEVEDDFRDGQILTVTTSAATNDVVIEREKFEIPWAPRYVSSYTSYRKGSAIVVADGSEWEWDPQEGRHVPITTAPPTAPAHLHSEGGVDTMRDIVEEAIVVEETFSERPSVISGCGEVLHPGDPVAWCPESLDCPMLFGTLVGGCTDEEGADVLVLFDTGDDPVEQVVTLPLDRLYLADERKSPDRDREEDGLCLSSSTSEK